MTRTRQRQPLLRRMHFRRDGQPKKALTPHEATRARRFGMRTYDCPICDAVHAASSQRRRP